jgi:hypothetical protein
MPRPTNTYAVRLAVEGGGQVKAELVSVGQSGEQSLKRIETAGGRASGGGQCHRRRRELVRASQGQIAADMARAIDRASRNR